MSEGKVPEEAQVPEEKAPEGKEAQEILPEYIELVDRIYSEAKKRREHEAHASSPVSEHLSQKEEEVVG